MKKFLVLILVICLCGCNNKQVDNDDNGSTIEENSFVEPQEQYPDIVGHKDYLSDNYDLYVKYYDSFELDKLIELVNSNILNDDNCDKLVSLYNSEFYVSRLEDKYLEYLDEYDNVRDLLEIINTKRYLPLYSSIEETDLSKDYLMLINKYHQLPSDYEPSDMVDIEEEYGYGITRQAVYDAFVQMADDAYLDGYVLAVTSAYRSYDYQDGLYNKYLDMEGGNVAAVDCYSARPGHSEHQSGLCLDLVTPGYSMDDFGLSDASKWVDENCYKYGFIIRYTAQKEDITGYEAEAWQVRYVGDKDIAKYIMDSGITFDEYYTCFVE